MRTTEPVQKNGDKMSHPAFGVIGASRFTTGGNGYVAYGSGFRHRSGITIRVSTSTQHDYEGHHTLRNASDNIVELILTEAQWSGFVSTLNSGEGVPCTLQRVGRELSRPEIDPEGYLDDGRIKARKNVSRAHDEQVARLRALASTASTKKLAFELTNIADQLDSNLPYIVKRFDEHAEETVAEAQIAIEAYAQARSRSLGLAPEQVAITKGNEP